jgi:hypothetical protein
VCVCSLTWGWNEDGEPPRLVKWDHLLGWMAFAALGAWMEFGGGSLPPFLR